MVGYRNIIVFLGLILASCAQVGTITGGPVDTNAPQPVEKKSTPPNGSTNFTGNEVEITFDEFFRLNEPNINIRMVPAHTTVNARVKGKKLILDWEDELQPNTTYAIYLNNAVRDITERNDTVMQFAFSTGPILDTLTYEISVADAWTSNAVAKCLVGLFNPETNELLNFAETSTTGQAKLSYLQANSYKLLAWVDQNNDLELQDHERVGFINEGELVLTENQADSIPIRLFKPEASEPEITTATYIVPGSIYAGANISLVDALIQVNGEIIDKDHYQIIGTDSLHIFKDLTDTNAVELIISSNQLQDTSTFRFFNRTMPDISLRPTKNNLTYSPWEELTFRSNAFIESVDTSFIEITRVSDSTLITDYSYSYMHDALTFELDSNEYDLYLFSFDEGALNTTHGSLAAYESKITLNPERKYGSLIVDLNYYSPSDIIVYLMQSGRILKEVPLKKNAGEYTFVGLQAGTYAFVVVHDENANGRWDVGNLDGHVQPEQVDHYSTAVKVRANWDVDLSLIPNE
ncbi:MAG: Ig-like domain-containing protein [Crocinitomicaceae bacterium]|nr:Ig-like domain-containing protein [Crocinitomicaceae bacterium]